MYIPSAKGALTSGLALAGSLTANKPSSIAKGSVLDYAVETCVDTDGNQRCTTPFLVSKETCYTIIWSTEGTFSHTTAEVRDAGSGELVYYRDTDGEWNPKKGELVYIDFKPKIGGGNSTVDYEVKTCDEGIGSEEM